MKPPKVNLLAGEHKATELCFLWGFTTLVWVFSVLFTARVSSISTG